MAQGKKKIEESKKAARLDRVTFREIRNAAQRYTGADKGKSDGQRPKKDK